jgi:4a-hydroxytetrahydrobiopterin dehydratase
VALLSETGIEKALSDLPHWKRQGSSLARSLDLGSFEAAIAFVNRVAQLAEAADHHPDIDIRYSRVSLVLSTHSAGGLTQRDVDLASQIDRLVA